MIGSINYYVDKDVVCRAYRSVLTVVFLDHYLVLLIINSFRSAIHTRYKCKKSLGITDMSNITIIHLCGTIFFPKLH